MNPALCLLRYHPELQPIERVWCAVKNEIAHNPVASMTELKERLAQNFRDLVTQKVLLGTWRKSVEYVEQYASWSTDTAGCSADPEAERDLGEQLPENGLDMEEDDLEKLSKKPRWTTTTKSCHRLGEKCGENGTFL